MWCPKIYCTGSFLFHVFWLDTSKQWNYFNSSEFVVVFLGNGSLDVAEISEQHVEEPDQIEDCGVGSIWNWVQANYFLMLISCQGILLWMNLVNSLKGQHRAWHASVRRVSKARNRMLDGKGVVINWRTSMRNSKKNNCLFIHLTKNTAKCWK